MQIAGDHPGALSSIEGLATRTVADQVMVTTNVYGHAKRCFTVVLAGVYDMINHLS
jgi:hypothetical protein